MGYINENVITLINLAISEDVKNGLDITSVACIPEKVISKSYILAKEEGIIFGHEVSKTVFSLIDNSIDYKILIKDANRIIPGDIICEINGPLRSILTAERVALNFLQRLSAVSTITQKVVSKIYPLKTKILDTRKTTPAYRSLEKAAVLAGGGYNHRLGLYDEYLIKNNHIDALDGNVVKAINLCRDLNSNIKLKVEVRNRAELEAALSQMPDGIMLDNYSPEEMTSEVKWIRDQSKYNKISLEASGGINLENVRSYAETGIDEISLGSLTHSAKSIDLSLRIKNF